MASSTGRGWLLPLLILFIASFAVSQGAVIWVYLSEIFPTDVRARGQAIGSATHWILNALIAGAFPSSPRIPSRRRSHFCMHDGTEFIAALLLMPETRGIALDRMNEIMGTAAPAAAQRICESVPHRGRYAND